MSIDGPGQIASTALRGSPDGGFLGRLRAAARIAVVAGAVGSLGLMLRAGRSTPRLLLALFVIWILSPFVALAWVNVVSQRWSVLTRATLYCVTLVLTLGSLAIYGELVKRPTGSANAFMFVIVPPASWLLMAIVVPIAARISRRRSRRGEEHR
jgi:hypothetical protein